jgi:hypothetical protein|tara:strand:+ start:353 stop:655 length:303 start_codon:yes stop_codon:yes gene_type:complete
MRQINSKFRGVCKVCGNHVAQGERVWWERGQGVWHLNCSPESHVSSFYEEQEHQREQSRLSAELERGKRDVEEWREMRQLFGGDVAEAMYIQSQYDEDYY